MQWSDVTRPPSPRTLRQFAGVIPLYCRLMDDYLGELLAASGDGTKPSRSSRARIN